MTPPHNMQFVFHIRGSSERTGLWFVSLHPNKLSKQNNKIHLEMCALLLYVTFSRSFSFVRRHAAGWEGVIRFEPNTRQTTMLNKPSCKANWSSRKKLDQVPLQGHTARTRYLRGGNFVPIFSSDRCSGEFLKESCEWPLLLLDFKENFDFNDRITWNSPK